MNKNSFYNHDGSKHFNPKEQLAWRLEWLDKQIKLREGRGEVFDQKQKTKWLSEEQRVYENNLKDFDRIKKLQKDTCIIVPTHYYHAPWLRACLESCRATGLFVILAYDNPLYDEKQQLKFRFPNAKTLMMADYTSIKHKTWGSGVGIPHSWNMWYGLHAAQSFGFKYVFNLNGDCILEKPENLPQLRQKLGNDDIISCEWHPKRYMGTMAYLGKMEHVVKLWDMNLERMYQYNYGNAEARFGKFAHELGLKVTPVENPEDPHHKPPGVKGTIRNMLGMRHLHAEHKVRRWDKLEPIEEKYCEIEYMNTHEQNTLLKYWKSGNKKHLQAWWK